MARIKIASALLRLVGVALLSAAAWTVNVTIGLAATGLAVLAVVYLPDGDA